jgi:hypothetical protein
MRNKEYTFHMSEEYLNKSYEKIRLQAESFYTTIGEVECPYFNDTVAFNSKGIKHIKFKKDTVARSHSDQFIRLKNINLAPRIINKSKTLQEYKETKCFEEKKAGGKREMVLQEVKYFAFIAILKDDLGRLQRLKIVVKQVANGKPYFWSIIPFWKSNRELSRQMHSGNPEID